MAIVKAQLNGLRIAPRKVRAVANMVKDNLYVKDFIVNEGVKLRRFKPKGFGRASPLQKKTSLIKLVLAERVAGMKREIVKETAPAHDHEHEHGQEHGHVSGEKKQRERKKPEIKTEIGKKSKDGQGFVKRLFQRKSI